MKAIIPVAGEGTRLRPHTYVVPKVLLNVGGKPILSHIVDKAIDAGVDDFAFIIGYKGDLIREFIEDRFDVNTTFYMQDDMLGLAHAIGLAQDYLVDEPVFIILGDTIFDADLKPVFEKNVSSLGVREVEDPRRFGTVETDDSGIITKVVEKPKHPKSNLAIVGLYYFTEGVTLKESIRELIDSGKKTKDEYQVTDAIQIMIDKGMKIGTFPVDGWFDCGKPETMLSTNRYLLSVSPRSAEIPGSLIRPPVYIDPSSEIENSIVGPNTTVARGAKIRNAIINNSIIGEESSVADIILKDSIIGNHASVSGTHKSFNITDHSDISL